MIYENKRHVFSGHASYSVKRLDFILLQERGRVLGNQEFPKWNPQAEFISDEEKQEFQGF